MCAKNKNIYAWRKQAIVREIATHDLYCCLLPRCEALRKCRSGFPITGVGCTVPSRLTTEYPNSCIQIKQKFAVEKKCILSSKSHNRAEKNLKIHETAKLMHMFLTYSKTWKYFETVFGQWSIYYDLKMLWKWWHKNILNNCGCVLFLLIKRY